MKKQQSIVSIVIPAHNEEANLPSLISNLLGVRRKLPPTEIIIVDDNSNDKTLELARIYSRRHTFIRSIHRDKGNNGMGAALKAGTNIAKGKYVIWIMGDNSDSISALPKFVAKLEKGYDVVVGSRYISGGSCGNLNPVKALLSSGYTSLARVIFGIRIHDITNAFRAFRKKVYDKIKPEENQFAISPEFIIKAQQGGYRISEVPTGYTDRQAGVSKFKLLKMGVSYISLFRLRLRRI